MPTAAETRRIVAAVRKAPGIASRSPSPTSTASCAASTCTRTSSVGAAEGGFGFCDVVFGWDMMDVTLRQHARSPAGTRAFPDALARIDLGTYRTVPWDDDVPFFLGEFVNARRRSAACRSARARC